MKSWTRKDILVMTGAAAAIICMVVLFFFRPEVYSGFLSAFGAIFAPFIYGAMMAYLMNPLCRRIESLLRWSFKTEKDHSVFRVIAAVLSIVLFFLVISMLLTAIVPELVTTISELIRQMPEGVARLEAWLESVIPDDAMIGVEGQLESITEYIENFLETNVLPHLSNIMSAMTNGFSGALGIVKNIFVGIFIAVYMLISKEKLKLQSKMILYALLPRRAADWVMGEAVFADEKFSGFIFGKVIDSAIIGLICFIFTMFTRMPYALLISIIIGITNIIPVFGPFFGAIPSTILILTVSPAKALIFVIFIIVLQQVDGNVIGPKILGDRLGLSAFWTLFSILIFGSLWGVGGMLIGAPLFAVLYDIVRDFVLSRLRARGEESILAEYEKTEGHEGVLADNKK